MKRMLRSFMAMLLLAPLLVQAAEDVPFLLTASAQNDVATVQALLDSGASPNIKDAEGISALMYAARKDSAAAVRVLLDKGADINAVDNDGWTALMFAAKKNHVATVKVLLRRAPTIPCAMLQGGARLGLPPLPGTARWWIC